MKTPEQRIARLEHENQMLKQKIQILELSVEIEKRKLESERLKRPHHWNPGGVTWTTSTSNTAGKWTSATMKHDMDRLVAKINRHMKGNGSDAPPNPIS